MAFPEWVTEGDRSVPQHGSRRHVSMLHVRRWPFLAPCSRRASSTYASRRQTFPIAAGE